MDRKVKIKESIYAILFFLVAIALNVGMYYLRFNIFNAETSSSFLLGLLQITFNAIMWGVSYNRRSGDSDNKIWSCICATLQVVIIIELIIEVAINCGTMIQYLDGV